MAAGSVSYAKRAGTYVLRFEGAIRYTLGHALDTFLDRLFAQADFDTIIVDLIAAESIDSTGLGLLAKIANFVRSRNGSKPLLFSSNPDINEVLKAICMDQVFVLCDRAPQFGPGDALPDTDPSKADLARTVLGAHRLLCEMNENNRALFQNVVDALEKDLDAA